MFSPHFESWGRDSSHAGWGCQFSINLLPRLICRLHSESAWDHFSAMQSWWKVPTWPAIWGQTGELICASSPSGRAHAALLRLHLLIFSTTFVSCSCLRSLIPPPPPDSGSFLFCFFVCCCKHTPKKSESLIVKANKASGDSLAFGCSAPAPEYCPLLFFFLFFCSVAPNHLLRSLWWPLLKHSLRTNTTPPHPQPSSSSPPPPMKKT